MRNQVYKAYRKYTYIILSHKSCTLNNNRRKKIVESAGTAKIPAVNRKVKCEMRQDREQDGSTMTKGFKQRVIKPSKVEIKYNLSNPLNFLLVDL